MLITKHLLIVTFFLSIYAGLLLKNISAIRLFIGDEPYYSDSVVAILNGRITEDDHHPLFIKTWWYFWVYLFYILTGTDNVVFWRIGTIIASVSSLLIFNQICNYFFDRKTSAIATILLAIDPIFFSFSRQLVLDIPAFFLMLVAFKNQLEFITTRSYKALYLSSIFIGLAFAGKISTPVLLFPITLALIFFIDSVKHLSVKPIVYKSVLAVSLFILSFIAGNFIFFFKQTPAGFVSYIRHIFVSQFTIKYAEGFLSSPAWTWFTIPQIVTLIRILPNSAVQTLVFFQNPTFFILTIPSLIIIFIYLFKSRSFSQKNSSLILVVLSFSVQYFVLAVTGHQTYYHQIIPLLPLIIILSIYSLQIIFGLKYTLPILLTLSLLIFFIYFPVLNGTIISPRLDHFLFKYSKYNFPPRDDLYCQKCSPRE